MKRPDISLIIYKKSLFFNNLYQSLNLYKGSQNKVPIGRIASLVHVLGNTMNIEQYYSEDNQTFTFSREQASAFAKGVADDFNPIHDIDAKRFCVPGDLLFTIALHRLGLREKTQVVFADMVSDEVVLKAEGSRDNLDIVDDSGKTYLKVNSSGFHINDPQKIDAIVKQYVAFSGKTFPHILVPLWRDKNVMVNPKRPMVIYESMTLSILKEDFDQPTLELAESELKIEGKRGRVCLQFNYMENGEVVAEGQKNMVLSGLRAYEQPIIDDLIEFYNERKRELGTAQ